MKSELQLKAADNLAPIREQITGFIKPASTVVDFGCGSGDLLLKLSPKIKSGLGIDKSKALIESAIAQRKRKNISNIDFLCKELGEEYEPTETYDYSIASLFLHVIPRSQSIYLLQKMREISRTTLLCGFSKPKTLKQKLLLWFDQRFSGHYQNFRVYQKQGFMEGLIAEVPCANVITYDTHIPFVKIYQLH